MGNSYIEWMNVDDFREIKATYHASYIALWDIRAGRIIIAPHMVGIIDFHDPYLQWYHRITRRFMTPPLHRDDMRCETHVKLNFSKNGQNGKLLMQ